MKKKYCFLSMAGVYLMTAAILYAGERKTRENEVLTFDDIPPIIMDQIYLENDENILPLPGDFKIITFAPMSNLKGDRWVLVSIRNTATGVRIFTHRHIVATFADGSRKHAKKFELTLKSREFLSESIEFGNSKFPIVKVETSPKD